MNKNICVDKCPSDKPYIYNSFCVAQCKDKDKSFINSIDSNCLFSCSKGYDYIVETNDGTKTCYAQCPSRLENEKTNKCVFSLGKYVPGKLCVRVIADTNVKDRSQTITLDIY